MKYLLVIFFFCQFLALKSQDLIVNQGFFSLHHNTSLSLQNTNLVINNASLIGQDSTKVYFLPDTSFPQIKGYGLLNLDSLKIGSEVSSSLYSAVKTIKLVRGNLNQENVYLDLRTQILGEDETSKISGGTTRTLIKPTANNFTFSGNVGLQFLFATNVDSFVLTRQNKIVYTDENYSINRLYAISDSTNQIQQVNFYYLNNELENLNTEKLQVFTSTDLMRWKPQQTLTRNTSNKFINANIDGYSKYFALFEEIEPETFFIPNGFSPNNDGVNDFFEILGLQEYPNNKLIVFDANGAILFEASPYLNNWDGYAPADGITADNGKLNTGTYYYFFYKDASKKNEVEKGFIELRSGR